MYLLQEKQVKRKKMGALFRRLPSLDVLDDINYRCLTIGFPFLTVGIITRITSYNVCYTKLLREPTC